MNWLCTRGDSRINEGEEEAEEAEDPPPPPPDSGNYNNTRTAAIQWLLPLRDGGIQEYLRDLSNPNFTESQDYSRK